MSYLAIFWIAVTVVLSAAAFLVGRQHQRLLHAPLVARASRLVTSTEDLLGSSHPHARLVAAYQRADGAVPLSRLMDDLKTWDGLVPHTPLNSEKMERLVAATQLLADEDAAWGVPRPVSAYVTLALGTGIGNTRAEAREKVRALLEANSDWVRTLLDGGYDLGVSGRYRGAIMDLSAWAEGVEHA